MAICNNSNDDDDNSSNSVNTEYFYRVAPRYIHSSLPSNPLDIFAFPNSTISLLPFLRLIINSLSRNQLARGCVKIKVNLKKRQNTLF